VRVDESLRPLLSRGSVSRGDAYFAQGRVRRIDDVAPGVLAAAVQGSRLYTVELRLDGDELTVRCDCPWFVDRGEDCKHIWAAIRAASLRGLLPDEELYLTLDDSDLAPVHPFPSRRAQRPAWQRFLDALGPAAASRREGAARNVPEEIAYVIAPAAVPAPGLTLKILGRARRKNGEWGRWKAISIGADDLRRLPAFDRDTIALLNERTWSYTIESSVTISGATTAWWIERLARAEKLFLARGGGDPAPVTWDDGPPWTLFVGIVNDDAASAYRIDAAIQRAGETLPFDHVEAILPDVVISAGRAARFDDRGQGAWLQALRANGPVEVPHHDVDRFRQALLRAPFAGVALPPELGWSVVDVEPQPILSLQQQSWGSELQGELFFAYDEWRVASRSSEMQTTIAQKLIRRNRAAENRLRDRVVAAGAIAAWDGYRVRAAQLDRLARTLIAEGWMLEIDATTLRVADELEMELSSGIDWFDLHVNASFGGAGAALPEILAAAEGKRSMLRLSDGSYGIVPASWEESLAPILELGKREGDALRFRPVQALLIDALLGAKTRKADDAFDELRARVTGATPEPRQEPPTLAAELRPYQRAGLGWLHFLRESGLGGCLADDMGLGKTVQTLALLEELRAGGNARPSLVVAPRSLLFNWAAEAKRFAPKLRVLEHHGPERDRNVFDDYDVVLTTYATMRLDVARLAETEFEYVILDEAQAIKNASSQVAKASRLLRGRHRLALSGTPIENHLGELWSLFEFLDPGLLGSARAFSRTFASKSAPPERREALARALRPLILRRTKEQVAPELPERTEQTLYCELEGKQRRQYDELREHYRSALLERVQESGIEKSRMKILEALLRLRQAACHPALLGGDDDGPSAKVELLMEELGDVLDSGHRALVFSQFTSFLHIVRAMLDEKKIPYLYLDGKTRDRQSLVDAFQSAGGPPLFLISLKAGGLGLNLTNADYIFLLDPWWNPAVEAQAIDRAHRIGRRKPVVAYRLIARDTVEEKILELQAQKREVAESIISADNSVLRKLDVEDLELLLS
jgi:superfamily II DNA or RNA helicase